MGRLRYPEPPLRDERVVLRRWRVDDLPCVEEASRDPEIPQGTTVPAVWSRDEGLAYLRRQWARHDDGQGLSLVIADVATDVAVGHINAMVRRPDGTVEIGYWLTIPNRRRGYGGAAVRTWSRWLVGPAGMLRVEARVETSNVASQRTLEGAGFVREGRLRHVLDLPDRRADAYLYSLLPSDLEDEAGAREA